ncbi:MAG: NigD-like C-terminal domain-containing protein [Bacteroidota bacterium]|nr:NigD-like C-terminal domain-containing protein [Bacteroidota bacterium]
MKKIIRIIPVLFLAVYLSSCLNTDDDNDNKVYYQLFATVASNSTTPTFKTDDGSTLVSTGTVDSDSSKFYKVGDRIFIRFTLGDTTASRTTKIYPITVVNYAKATVKDVQVVAADSADPYKNCNFYSLYALWLSADYMDVVVKTYISYNSLNTVELVRYKGQESNLQTDTVPAIHLEIRHNTPAVLKDSYVVRACSFDLSSLKTEFPNAVKFKLIVSWNDDNTYGSNSYQFTYTPVDNASQLAGAAFFRKQAQWSSGKSFSY